MRDDQEIKDAKIKDWMFGLDGWTVKSVVRQKLDQMYGLGQWSRELERYPLTGTFSRKLQKLLTK